MRCRLYIDEVGNGDLKGAAEDDNVRYLSLTGIVTTVSLHATKFEPDLFAIKEKFFGHTAADRVILHRRDIMKRTGKFAVLHDPTIRAQFDDELFNLLNGLPFNVITVTIDKRQHLEKYKVWRFDPYHYCMCCLVERYVRWMDDRGTGVVGDVVAEARNKTPDKKLKASFARIHSKGTEQLGPAWFQSRLTSGELKLHPKTDDVAGLQVADLLAHPLFRDMKHTRDGKERPNDFGGKISSMVEKTKFRRSYKGAIDGYGRKWLP